MARAVGRSRQPLREACGKRKHDARPDTPLTESVRSTYSSGRAFHFLKPLGSSHTPSSRPDQAMRPSQNKARASDEREQERRRPDSDDRDERRMQQSLVPFVSARAPDRRSPASSTIGLETLALLRRAESRPAAQRPLRR
jgi:hypothetical protein